MFTRSRAGLATRPQVWWERRCRWRTKTAIRIATTVAVTHQNAPLATRSPRRSAFGALFPSMTWRPCVPGNMSAFGASPKTGRLPGEGRCRPGSANALPTQGSTITLFVLGDVMAVHLPTCSVTGQDRSFIHELLCAGGGAAVTWLSDTRLNDAHLAPRAAQAPSAPFTSRSVAATSAASFEMTDGDQAHGQGEQWPTCRRPQNVARTPRRTAPLVGRDSPATAGAPPWPCRRRRSHWRADVGRDQATKQSGSPNSAAGIGNSPMSDR